MAVAKVMISLPKDFLKEIDREIRKEHRTRSEFFREAARLYLQLKYAAPGQDPRVQRAVALQDAIARKDRLATWDGTTEIRRWRQTRK
jgi:metal-responsive CopG/Arc/MetJ family transcriptional regulator